MTSNGGGDSLSISLSLRASRQHKDTRSYPGSGRPEANSPTPACLDYAAHHGDLTMVVVFRVTREMGGWRLKTNKSFRRRALLANELPTS